MTLDGLHGVKGSDMMWGRPENLRRQNLTKAGDNLSCALSQEDAHIIEKKMLDGVGRIRSACEGGPKANTVQRCLEYSRKATRCQKSAFGRRPSLR